MKIAYFSPLNPIRSGISDYSKDLLPYLADLIDVDLFIDDFEPSNQALVERFNVYPIQEYPRRRWDYDMALYHMGNNLYHEAIYETAIRYPGVVALHDYALVGMISNMTWGRQNRGAFVREWGYMYGLAGIAKARQVLDGHDSVPADEPLNRRLIDLSLGIIVHSDYVRHKVLGIRPLAAVERIPMLWVSHQLTSMTHQAARRELGLDEGKLYIGSFGFVVPNKQVELLLDLLDDLLVQFPTVHLIFVGEPLAWYNPVPLIEERGLTEQVTITGYLPFSAWCTFIKAVDLAVNLRYPTMGETSATVVRLMGGGVPTIVSDVGWYSEIPSDCAIKMKMDESVRTELYSVVANLLSDPERRQSLGQQGQRYVSTHHTASQVAQRYVEFIQRIALRGLVE